MTIIITGKDTHTHKAIKNKYTLSEYILLTDILISNITW